MKVSCLQSLPKSWRSTRFKPESITFAYLCQCHMPNPNHHQTNKLQFADDASQWGVSKNINLATAYLQRDLEKLARWCAKWRIKLNPERTKVIIFSKSQTAIRQNLLYLYTATLFRTILT